MQASCCVNQVPRQICSELTHLLLPEYLQLMAHCIKYKTIRTVLSHMISCNWDNPYLVNTTHQFLQCIDLHINLQRWFVSGTIGCFTGGHIPLALLAIAGLLVALMLIPLVCLISQKQHLMRVRYTGISIESLCCMMTFAVLIFRNSIG